LREKQRFELSKLLEARKAKPSLLKVFPSSVQLLNSLLENLRRNFTQPRELLLSFWQVVKLLNFSRELYLRREDVLFFQGASIYQALTTVTPIFYLPKCVVVRSSTDLHPLNELLFLGGVWIDSVTVGKCQHLFSILNLLDNSAALKFKFRDIEFRKLNWGSPCIPNPLKKITRRTRCLCRR
jgi:hypothetical protein